MKISHLVPTGEPSKNPAIQRPRSNSLDGIQTVFDKPRSGWIDEMRNARWAQYHMEQVSVSDADSVCESDDEKPHQQELESGEQQEQHSNQKDSQTETQEVQNALVGPDTAYSQEHIKVGPDQPMTGYNQQVHKKSGPNKITQSNAQVQTKGTTIKMKSKGISAALAPAQSSKQIQIKPMTQTIAVGVNEQLLAESSLELAASSFETVRATALPVAQSALPLMHKLIAAAKQLATSETTHQSEAKEIVEIAKLFEGTSKEEQEFFYMGILPRYCPSWQESAWCRGLVMLTDNMNSTTPDSVKKWCQEFVKDAHINHPTDISSALKTLLFDFSLKVAQFKKANNLGAIYNLLVCYTLIQNQLIYPVMNQLSEDQITDLIQKDCDFLKLIHINALRLQMEKIECQYVSAESFEAILLYFQGYEPRAETTKIELLLANDGSLQDDAFDQEIFQQIPKWRIKALREISHAFKSAFINSQNQTARQSGTEGPTTRSITSMAKLYNSIMQPEAKQHINETKWKNHFLHTALFYRLETSSDSKALESKEVVQARGVLDQLGYRSDGLSKKRVSAVISHLHSLQKSIISNQQHVDFFRFVIRYGLESADYGMPLIAATNSHESGNALDRQILLDLTLVGYGSTVRAAQCMRSQIALGRLAYSHIDSTSMREQEVLAHYTNAIAELNRFYSQPNQTSIGKTNKKDKNQPGASGIIMKDHEQLIQCTLKIVAGLQFFEKKYQKMAQDIFERALKEVRQCQQDPIMQIHSLRVFLQQADLEPFVAKPGFYNTIVSEILGHIEKLPRSNLDPLVLSHSLHSILQDNRVPISPAQKQAVQTTLEAALTSVNIKDDIKKTASFAQMIARDNSLKYARQLCERIGDCHTDFKNENQEGLAEFGTLSTLLDTFEGVSKKDTEFEAGLRQCMDSFQWLSLIKDPVVLADLAIERVVGLSQFMDDPRARQMMGDNLYESLLDPQDFHNVYGIKLPDENGTPAAKVAMGQIVELSAIGFVKMNQMNAAITTVETHLTHAIEHAVAYTKLLPHCVSAEQAKPLIRKLLHPLLEKDHNPIEARNRALAKRGFDPLPAPIQLDFISDVYRSLLRLKNFDSATLWLSLFAPSLTSNGYGYFTGLLAVDGIDSLNGVQ